MNDVKLQYYRLLSLVLVGVMIIVPLLSQTSYAMTVEELPEGEVILSELNLEKAILKPGSEAYGSMEIVDVEGEAFTEALRFTTDVQPAYTYDIQYEIPIEAAIAKDDVLLASFYARTISSSHETAEGTVALVMEKLETWDKSITEQVSIPTEWKKFYVPIIAAIDMGKNQSQVALRVGFKPQVIEIAEITVVNFKKAITIEDLPRTPVYYEGMEDDAPWRVEADKRIEQNRKGDLEIVVLNEHGQPVEEADVHVEMKKHDFGFGTAVNSTMIFGTDENSEMYRKMLKENFNSVVMENELKWPWWEGDKARTVKLYNWLGENSFDVRGHTLLWDGLTRMPADIGGIYDDPNQIHKRIEDHFHEAAGYFKGRLVDWDVLNEPTANNVIRGIYGDAIAVDWFKLAKEADPYAKLYVNETQIIGIDGPVIAQFSDFLQTLVDNGAPIDGIGIQAHFGSTPVAPMAFYDQLTHFAQYADEIAISEFDMNSPQEDIQGQFSRDILIASFSHPNVQSFTMWGFWDGAHWQSNAPLYRSDWTLKPSGEEWRRLIYDVWWTDDHGTTDTEGAYRTRGFYGEYDITVAYEGKEQTHHTSLLKNADNKLIVVLGQEQTDDSDKAFIPLPIPDQNADITAPVWRYGSAFGAANVSPTSVTLQWPNAYDNNGVDHYSIYQDGSLYKQVPARITSYDVTGLEQGKTYTFTIVAVDGTGNRSAESNEIVVTTAASEDATIPGWDAGSFITMTDLGTTSTLLSWPSGVDNVGPEAYRIYLNDQFIYETEEQSYLLKNLSENTVYTVRVEAKDQNGNVSVGGPVVVFKTLGAKDTVPPIWYESTLTASEVKANSLTLNWPTAVDNLAVTAYRIFKNNEELITLPATVTSYQVNGLSDYTSYDFRIEAGDAANNWSNAGPELTVLTAVESDLEKPVWPSNRLLTYSALTDQELTLEWTAAQDNIGVTAYRIYKDDVEIASVEGDTLTYSMTNLAANQTYTFRVEAVDGFSNLSIDGPSITVKTYEGLVRQQLKIAPSDDAFPQAPATFGGAGSNNNENYLRYKNAAGASGYEETKNTGNNRRIYMKFPLDTITGSVYEASLNVYVFAVQSPNMDIGMDLYKTGDDWSETNINWLNKPAEGEKLASTTIRDAGYWKSFEVTNYVISEVNGDKEISFLIQDDLWLDQNVDIYSKEASNPELRPYLLIGSEAVETDNIAPTWIDGSLDGSDVKPTSVTLTWTGATDEIGIQRYNVYQDEVLIATVGADVNLYVAKGLSPSTLYSFKIEAEDTLQESADGPQISVMTADADQVKPTWPAETSVEASDVTRFEVRLQWTAAEDQYGIDKYIIYAEDQAVSEVDGSTTVHTLTNLLAGTTYEFTISAVDAAGNEAKGPAVTVTTEAADTEVPLWIEGSQIVAAIVNANGVQLIWPAAFDDTDVAGYSIYLGDVKIADVGKYITHYYIQGLEPNTSYTFFIDAFDEAGNRSEPLELIGTKTLETDTIYPVWPTGSRITAKLTGEDVSLHWNHALDNTGIKHYLIYRNGILLDTVSGDVTNYIIKNSDDLAALYKVEAEDYSGNMTQNGPSTGDPTIPTPGDTTPPTWRLGSKLIAEKITETSVRLSWDEATDKSGISEYHLLVDGTVFATTSSTTLLLENLKAGSTYQIKVEAVDHAGNVTIDGPSLTVNTLEKQKPDPGTVTPPSTNTGQSDEENAHEVAVINGQVIIQVKQVSTNNGQAIAVLDDKTLTDAFEKSKQASNGVRKVTVKLPKATSANSYMIEIPSHYVTENGYENQIEISTEFGSIILPGSMLNNNELAKKQKTVTILFSQSELLQHISVNGKLGVVLELGVEANGQILAYDNKEASVIVRIPYKLNEQEQENVEFLSVWHIDEQGNIQLMPTGAYDSTTEEVVFETHHFSQFFVSYYKKTFTDLSSVPWAQQAIEVMASKGIINGVSAQLYQPEANITRADFTKILIETLGITAAIDSSFKDVNEDDYYYEAVGIARALGIVLGNGDELFDPKSQITRQDMMVILARALNYMDPALSQASNETLANYKDADQISAYALNAVAALVKTGLVQGSNDRIEPLHHATRAEAAIIMYRLFHYVFQ